MDTLAFFEKVLPSQGAYVLAEFRDGLANPPRHSIHNSLSSLANRAVAVDAQGVNVFHACHTFGYDDQRKVRRKADNAEFFRSLYIDLDVGEGKPYATQREAVGALSAALKATGLPQPLVVSSGRGLHCYWPFEADLKSKSLWLKLAGRLHTALITNGLQIDEGVTMDAARILRPVGSHHRKADPIQVKVLLDRGPYPMELIVKPLAKFSPPARQKFDASINSDLAVVVDYPPSSVSQIIKFCPTLAHIADRAGDVGEPLWHASIGLLKHTVEGEAACHAYSEGHPNYDAEQTQRKIDNWTAGPTTCQQFRGCEGNQCTGCTRNVKSPIHLGYAEVAPPTEAVEAAVEAAEPEPAPTATVGGVVQAAKKDAMMALWPARSRVSRKTIGEGEDATTVFELSRAIVKEPGEPPELVPFSNTMIMAIGRVQNEDQTWSLRCRADVGGRTRKFVIPGKSLASAEMLMPLLQEQEINVLPKKGEYMRQHLLDGREILAKMDIYSTTYKSFGWAKDHDVDTFVIGKLGIQPNRTVEILPSQAIANIGWGHEFATKGTQADYTRLVNEIYNRPGAELFQFVLMAAYAAPLVALVESTTWNGIPIALTGDTSSGKTTLCALACSIYGRGDIFTQPANRAGTTTFALYARAGILSNLPFVMDELTDTESEQCSDLLYALSNGRPRDRCNSAGQLVRQSDRWRTISFITSQRNLTELLSHQANSAITDATQVRVFEIRLPQSLSMHVFRGVNREKVETEFMNGQYGVMGRLWLQYLVSNRAAVAARLEAARKAYPLDTSDTRKERYFFDLIAMVRVAADITKELGWHDFDVDAISQWAEGNIAFLRGERKEHQQNADAAIDGFLRSLYQRTVVTKEFGDRKGHTERSTVEFRGVPVARVATDKKMMVVLQSALQEYCRDRKLDYQSVQQSMVERGIIQMPPPGVDRVQKNRAYRAYPFRGVADVISGQANVFRLDFRMWNGGALLRAPGEDDAEQSQAQSQ